MSKQELIAEICAEELRRQVNWKDRYLPEVLEGFPTSWLQRLHSVKFRYDEDRAMVWYAELGHPVADLDKVSKGARKLILEGAMDLLPGEFGQYSVYRMTFSDGAQYVGMTGRLVIDRIHEHFGGGPRGDGIGTIRIIERAALGPWYVEVICSGLSKREAAEAERREIRKLPAALNSMFATTQARELHDPGQSATARLWFGR